MVHYPAADNIEYIAFPDESVTRCTSRELFLDSLSDSDLESAMVSGSRSGPAATEKAVRMSRKGLGGSESSLVVGGGVCAGIGAVGIAFAFRKKKTRGSTKSIEEVSRADALVREEIFHDIIGDDGASLDDAATVVIEEPALGQVTLESAFVPAVSFEEEPPEEEPSGTSNDDTAPSSSGGQIRPNDRVLIFGTGDVGQLVSKKLHARPRMEYGVSICATNLPQSVEMLDDDAIDVVEMNLVGENAASDEQIEAAMAGAAGIVVTIGTTAFSTKRRDNGNNPTAVYEEAVTRIAKIASRAQSVRRLVLLSSIDVDKTYRGLLSLADKFGKFEKKQRLPVTNYDLLGVMDAKRVGERAVIDASERSGNGGVGGDGCGYEYSIIRPGRIVGGPYTNRELAKLLKLQGGTEYGVTIEKGDALVGDCKLDACAEAVVRCLENKACQNVAFSIASNKEKSLTEEKWTEELSNIM